MTQPQRLWEDICSDSGLNISDGRTQPQRWADLISSDALPPLTWRFSHPGSDVEFDGHEVVLDVESAKNLGPPSSIGSICASEDELPLGEEAETHDLHDFAESSASSSHGVHNDFEMRNCVLLSGRFTKDKIIKYIKLVHDCLRDCFAVNAFMVQVAPGESFGEKTAEGLARARVMVAFCTRDYGEKTCIGYETYKELQYVHEHSDACMLIPVKLSRHYPPIPPDERGRQLCKLAFSPSTYFIDGFKDPDSKSFKAPGVLAKDICDALRSLNLLTLCTLEP